MAFALPWQAHKHINMSKRRIILGIIFGVVLGVLAVFLLYPAIIIAKFNKDLIRVSTVQVNLGEKNIDLGIDIAIRKEAPFHRLLDSISYTVNFDTFQFVTGAIRLDSVRTGEEFDSILLPASIDKTVLRTAIRTLKGQDSTSLIIRFVAHYQWPIVDRIDVPIEVVRRMPPPDPPEVKLLNVDVAKFSFNDPIVDVTLQLTNNNAFELTLKDLHLYMEFEDLFKGEIHHPETIHIKPKDITIIDVTAEVHELKALRTIWQLLVKRNEVGFDMRILAKFVDAEGKADPIDITVTSKGKVQTKSKKEKKAMENGGNSKKKDGKKKNKKDKK